MPSAARLNLPILRLMGGKVNVQGAKMKALKIPAQRKTSRSQPKACRGGVLLPITAKIFAFAKRFAGNRYQSLAQAGLPCAARLNLPTLRLGGKIEFARAKICKPLKSRKERKRGSVSPQGVPCPSCLSNHGKDFCLCKKICVNKL